MFKDLGKKIKSLFGFSNKKNRTEIINDDLQSEANHFHSKSDEMELQIDGNWISKNVVESIFVKRYDQKLMKVCGQTELHRLEQIITERVLNAMQVLWTGCYSEVFKVDGFDGKHTILKISLINRRNKDGIVVQDMRSILSDVINSKRLSDLKSMSAESANYYCENFANVTNLYYVWSRRLLFNRSETKKSNTKSDRFEYLICQQTFGGKSLDSIHLISPSKGLSIISQLIASIAIAEDSMKFEHRDLHCSNILINDTKEEIATYVIKGKKFVLTLNGIKAVIIDTTFSRSSLKVANKENSETDYFVKAFYNDLSELCLDNYPDIQLKSVYLRQKQITHNKWHQFWPKTNINWLQYCIERIDDKVDKWSQKYSMFNHIKYFKDYKVLKSWKQNIAKYNSAKQFAKCVNFFE